MIIHEVFAHCGFLERANDAFSFRTHPAVIEDVNDDIISLVISLACLLVRNIRDDAPPRLLARL